MPRPRPAAAEEAVARLQAEEVAAAIAFLTSDQASFIAGHVLNVDGGTAM